MMLQDTAAKAIVPYCVGRKPLLATFCALPHEATQVKFLLYLGRWIVRQRSSRPRPSRMRFDLSIARRHYSSTYGIHPRMRTTEAVRKKRTVKFWLVTNENAYSTLNDCILVYINEREQR